VDGNGVGALTRHLYDNVVAGRRDILTQLLHDDFCVIGTREHLNRDDWLHLQLENSTFDKIDVTVVDAKVSMDNTAVVAAQVRFVGTQRGEPMDDVWNVIDVWQRRGMDWKLIGRTSFPASETDV
jgi:hypothetical protein